MDRLPGLRDKEIGRLTLEVERLLEQFKQTGATSPLEKLGAIFFYQLKGEGVLLCTVAEFAYRRLPQGSFRVKERKYPGGQVEYQLIGDPERDFFVTFGDKTLDPDRGMGFNIKSRSGYLQAHLAPADVLSISIVPR